MLNEEIDSKQWKDKEIFNMLIQNKEKAISKSSKANDIAYSENIRKCRQQYKRSLLNYKLNKTDENLKRLLKDKRTFKKRIEDRKKTE